NGLERGQHGADDVGALGDGADRRGGLTAQRFERVATRSDNVVADDPMLRSDQPRGDRVPQQSQSDEADRAHATGSVYRKDNRVSTPGSSGTPPACTSRTVRRSRTCG